MIKLKGTAESIKEQTLLLQKTFGKNAKISDIKPTKTVDEKIFLTKMMQARDNYDRKKGHQRCDDVLVSLLLHLGYSELIDLYNTQIKYYS